MIRRKKNPIGCLIILFAIPFILFFLGFLLFNNLSFFDKIFSPSENNKIPESKALINESPVKHKSFETIINQNKQQINILEINIKNAQITPILLYSGLQGFEKLSKISENTNAFAAVNAGFFNEYGEPLGLTFIDGKLFKKSTGMYPCLIIEDNKAYLKQLDPNESLANATMGYECGSWIIKNKKIVVPDKDELVGSLLNWDPRTAIGIKGNNIVYFLTIDGRQPGYSTGVTGKELADFLLGLGVDHAAMLDGGASTEMIVKGKIVNRPAYNREERAVAGGLVVKVL